MSSAAESGIITPETIFHSFVFSEANGLPLQNVIRMSLILVEFNAQRSAIFPFS